MKVQEHMDVCLDERDEELCQLHSQSQADGAQLAALSLQVQELMSSMEARAEVVGKDLEEINGRFDCHRGEINCLKVSEKDPKEEVEKLNVRGTAWYSLATRGLVLGGGDGGGVGRMVHCNRYSDDQYDCSYQ